MTPFRGSDFPRVTELCYHRDTRRPVQELTFEEVTQDPALDAEKIKPQLWHTRLKIEPVQTMLGREVL